MISMASSPTKREPASPPTFEETLASEFIDLYGSSLNEAIETVDSELDSSDSKAQVASKLLEGLERLQNLDEFIKEDLEEIIKGEPFPIWLEEEKAFGEVGLASYSPPLEQQHSTTTQNFWQEFESVLYGAPHQGPLTPPQSPPHFTTLTAPSAAATPTKQPPEYADQEQFLSEVLSFAVQQQPELQTDVARELAVVDELIRARVENLTRSPPSPSNSSSDDFSSDDPEWIPETVESSSSSDYETSSSPTRTTTTGGGGGGGRRRSKPYSRVGTEDRKSRKKEQNKNAATRYRMKKKAEVEEILKEETDLAKQNEGLECQITELRREIKYLKSLMRDVFKAKGLLN